MKKLGKRPQFLEIITGADGGGCYSVAKVQCNDDLVLTNQQEIDRMLIDSRLQFIPYMQEVLKAIGTGLPKKYFFANHAQKLVWSEMLWPYEVEKIDGVVISLDHAIDLSKLCGYREPHDA